MSGSFDYFRTAEDHAAIAAAPTGPDAAGLPTVPTSVVDPMVKLGRLVARLREEEWSARLVGLRQVHPSVSTEDNWMEPQVMALDDATRDTLAGAEDPDGLAAWWATTEEMGLDQVPEELAGQWCLALLALAGAARRHDEHLYVWSVL